MASEGATSFTFDAYGQQVSAGTSSYTWDAFNRMTGAAGPGDTVGLTYEGMSGEVASDSSASYSRNPAGDITGVDAAAGGKAIALDDQHADLSGLFTASGTTLTGSATYSPWGQVLGTSGPTVQVGYQGQWTDPLSGQVSMGSRFYQPQTGGFTSKDTYTGAEGGAASVSDNLYAYGNDNPVTVTDPSGHSPSGSSGYGNITAGDVAAAWGRAGEAKARAAGASAAAAAARGTAAVLSAAATGAEILARTLNSAAQKAQELAAQAAQLAARAFAAAARQLTVATSWQDKANAAWASARWHTANSLDIFNPVGDAANVWDAAKETGIALYDEARAGAAIITWGILEIAAEGAQLASDALHEASQVLAAAARGAAAAAVIATGAADAAERYARSMAAQAAADEAIASQDVAEAESLASAYYAQEQRRLAALRAAAERAVKRAAERAARAVKTAAKVVARVAVKAAKVAYKVSGAQSIVSCATNPTLSSCLQAAAAVAMIAATVATGGAAGAADVAAEGAIAATEDVAVDATE
ncbi:MAG: hypothetical protein JWM19_3245, partial [Actinomycetia bacterium]|nr:hypothetical protein [Actinomycetes bacterium]